MGNNTARQRLEAVIQLCNKPNSWPHRCILHASWVGTTAQLPPIVPASGSPKPIGNMSPQLSSNATDRHGQPIVVPPCIAEARPAQPGDHVCLFNAAGLHVREDSRRIQCDGFRVGLSWTHGARHHQSRQTCDEHARTDSNIEFDWNNCTDMHTFMLQKLKHYNQVACQSFHEHPTIDSAIELT